MVFGLFSKEKSLQRTIEKAINKLAQQPDRWTALEKLKEDGSEDALVGLCKRFSITSMKGVEDETEKLWVVDTLVAKGPTALAPLIRYMKTAEQLSFPLRVLERIADRDKVIEVGRSAARQRAAGLRPDARSADRPPALVRRVKPATDDELISRFTPYVTDFDENSRFSAIDGMSTRDPAKTSSRCSTHCCALKKNRGGIQAGDRRGAGTHEGAARRPGGRGAAVLTGPLADSFKVEGGLIKKR